MPRQKLRQPETRQPESPDDQRTPVQIAQTDANATDLEEYLEGMISQLRQIVGTSKWSDAVPVDLSEVAMWPPTYKVLLDESGNYLYVGEAVAGTGVAASTWRIFRLDESGAGDEELKKEWADGTTAFDKVWNSRASYMYSS